MCMELTTVRMPDLRLRRPLSLLYMLPCIGISMVIDVTTFRHSFFASLHFNAFDFVSTARLISF